MGEGDGLVYAVIGFFAGLYFFYKGFVWMKQKKLIENTPTSKIRSIAMGLVEIYGAVLPAEKKVLKSPFNNRDCVYYKYTVEEYRSGKKASHWVTVKEQEDSVPFYVKDDTGSVIVDPKGAQVDIPYDFQCKDIRPNIMKFLESKSISHKGLLFNKTMRFTEYLIEPKDKLYMMGTAGSNPFVKEGTAQKSEENIMIQKGRNDPFYYISDKPEKDVLDSFKWKVFGGLYGGAALSVACLTIILLYLGLF